jgi:D-serine deaminase-like pyridoxal phosphate-dependent protein
VIYGVPIALSNVSRLVHLASKLPPWTINILLDNVDAFTTYQDQLYSKSPKVGIFIKIDTGYHRAGIQTSSPAFPSLIEKIIYEGKGEFRGFYSHFGHSYGGNSEDDAAEGLLEELKGLEEAAAILMQRLNEPYTNVEDHLPNGLILTVGATPTATAAQNIYSSASAKANEVRDTIARLQLKKGFHVELHAGVYPLLDLQQVATHARSSSSPPAPGFMPLAKESIGLRLLVEVSSVYNEREKPEALISAGSLAFGREPCKSYPGWGIVSRSLGNQQTRSVYDDSEHGSRTGWIIGRISQEHGILTWEGERSLCNDLKIGQKLLVWPNHACVAGAGFGWYLVVDSDLPKDPHDDELKVVDVWVRWRGW